MASISEFAASIRSTNVSRPYLFYVTIIPPNGMLEDSKQVSMYCNSIQTPTTNLMTDDQYYENGLLRPAAHNYNYQNLTLEFIVDMDYKVKEFFDVWMNKIILSRRVFAFPSEYTAESLELNILSLANDGTGDNKKVYKYVFNQIFPKTINHVNLSTAGTNTASSFTVDFAFETFKFIRDSTNKTALTNQPDITNREILQTQYT